MASDLTPTPGFTKGPWEVAFSESKHRKGALGGGPGTECGPTCHPIRIEQSPDGIGPWAGINEIHVCHVGTADIVGPDGRHVVCLGGHDHDDAGLIENDADAHLIAAAPELYAALESVTYRLRNYAKWAGGKESCPDDFESIEVAEEVLKKARGQEGGR